MLKYRDVVLDQRGNALLGISAEIRVGGTETKATIYEDNAGVTEASNPLTTNTYGEFEFYAEDNDDGFDAYISGTGYNARTISDIRPVPEDDIVGSGFPFQFRGTFADGDTSPSVAAGSGVYFFANTSATTVDTFDDGVNGQVIVCLTPDDLDGNTNLNFQTGDLKTDFRASGSINWTTFDAFDMLIGIYYNELWWCICIETAPIV